MHAITSNERLQEVLAELARLGSPVDLSVATNAKNDAVEVRQTGEIHTSKIFELPSGQVAYMLNVTIYNKKTRPIDVTDCEIRTQHRDDLFHWLTPITKKFRGRDKRLHDYQVYQFPTAPDLEFGYEDVLNHHLVEGERLPGRSALSGMLLAVGGRMPALRHGQWAEVSLLITDTDDFEHSARLELWTDRLVTRPKVARLRKPLFGNFREVATETGTSSMRPWNFYTNQDERHRRSMEDSLLPLGDKIEWPLSDFDSTPAEDVASKLLSEAIPAETPDS